MNNALLDTLRNNIRSIPDYPKPGIMFRDITTLLAKGDLWKKVIDIFVERYQNTKIDRVVAIESRGFLLGAPLAYALGIGFVPVRKSGKLPFDIIKTTYSLEYGVDTLEMHVDGLFKNEKVLIIDDLLATGGTVSATIDLVTQLGGNIVETAFLVELCELKGRERMHPYPVFTVIQY